VEMPKVGTVPAWLMRTLALFPGQLKELGDTLYQFQYPFVLDSARSQEILGSTPTPLTEGAAATIAWWKAAELTQTP